MITLERLRYFIEVASLEHVGKAAKKVNVSPSVISSAIQVLEQEMECVLFLREKNRIKLNEKGFLLLEYAKILLKDSEQLRTRINSNKPELRGHYKIGASHFLMNEYLVPAFLELQNENPHLTIEFVSVDSGVAVGQILAGTLNAALIFRSSYYHDLNETVLNEGQFEIAVRSSHPLLKVSKSKWIERLSQLPAVTFRTMGGPNFWENHPLLQSLGIQPRHTFFYDDTQTALKLLNMTDAWAFLPGQLIESTRGLACLSFPRKVEAPVNISLIQNKNKASSSAIEKLAEILKARI